MNRGKISPAADKLLWSYYRIKGVPFGEYPYRFCQFMNKKIDKYILDYSKLRLPTAISGANLGEKSLSRLNEIFPDLKARIIWLADQAVSHRFEIFGITRDFGNPINWHLDPKTSISWPPHFWGDIDYKDGKTIGGIKFAWELNRLHHFPLLAMANSLTGDSKYKREIFDQLYSWMRANPYPKGINWIMGMELGIRIVNIVYALKFLGDIEPQNNEKDALLRILWFHGWHISRYLSKYSSCANHALAEALGLFILGLCFPTLEGADRWKNLGKKILEREVKRQIYPDGSSFEHSIFYLQFVVDIFLVYYLFCNEFEQPCDLAVKTQLRSSLFFISNILDKKGNYPAIGDDDEGYLTKLWVGPHNNFISLLNTGAVLFNDSSLIHESAEFDQKTFFLLGAESKQKWEDLRSAGNTPLARMRYFKNSGLAIFRDDGQKNILFVGNSGPLGLKPLGAHGHADALSFWLSIDGKPFIIDPGTFLYHDGGKWRRYFRSTLAHNTITVDGLDQAEMVADFLFRDFYRISQAIFLENEQEYCWSAAHDGYRKLKDPVFHKRVVRYLKKEQKIHIKDFLFCRRKHNIECLLHFHPDISISNNGRNFWAEWEKKKIKIQVDTKWLDINLFKGSQEPLLGWYSPRFNKKEETMSLWLRGEIHKNESFSTEVFLN